MLRIEDLEGLKIVDAANFASEIEVRDALENAYVQGSQGWGVRRDVAVILQLARNLRVQIELASTAETLREEAVRAGCAYAELQNKLKGMQLELGRVKKQRDAATAPRSTQDAG